MVFTQTVFSDRYIAVCHPIRARKIRTKTYGWLLASVAWLFSLGLSSQGSYIQDPIDEYYTTDDRKALKRSSAVRSYSWPVIYFVHLLNENNDRSVSYFISAIFNQNFNLFTIVHLKIVDRWPETVPHSISWEFKFLWFQKDRSNTSSYQWDHYFDRHIDDRWIRIVRYQQRWESLKVFYFWIVVRFFYIQWWS